MSDENSKGNGSWTDEEDSMIAEARARQERLLQEGEDKVKDDEQRDFDRHQFAKLNLRLTGVENVVADIKEQQIESNAETRKKLDDIQALLERLLIESVNKKKEGEG